MFYNLAPHPMKFYQKLESPHPSRVISKLTYLYSLVMFGCFRFEHFFELGVDPLISESRLIQQSIPVIFIFDPMHEFMTGKLGLLEAGCFFWKCFFESGCLLPCFEIGVEELAFYCGKPVKLVNDNLPDNKKGGNPISIVIY